MDAGHGSGGGRLAGSGGRALVGAQLRRVLAVGIVVPLAVGAAIALVGACWAYAVSYTHLTPPRRKARPCSRTTAWASLRSWESRSRRAGCGAAAPTRGDRSCAGRPGAQV